MPEVATTKRSNDRAEKKENSRSGFSVNKNKG